MSLPVLAPELQLLYIRPSHFHRLKTPICRQSISRYHSEAKKEMEIKLEVSSNFKLKKRKGQRCRKGILRRKGIISKSKATGESSQKDLVSVLCVTGPFFGNKMNKT